MNKILFLFFLFFELQAPACNDLLDTAVKILHEIQFKNLSE